MMIRLNGGVDLMMVAALSFLKGRIELQKDKKMQNENYCIAV